MAKEFSEKNKRILRGILSADAAYYVELQQKELGIKLTKSQFKRRVNKRYKQLLEWNPFVV